MPFKLKHHSTPLVETMPVESILTEEPIVTSQHSDEPFAAGKLLISETSTSEKEQIAILAYSYWQERGCPEGSPDQDWFRAEQVMQLSKLAKQVGRETYGLNQTMAESA